MTKTPLKIGLPSQKGKDRLPTNIFWVDYVSVRESKFLGVVFSQGDVHWILSIMVLIGLTNKITTCLVKRIGILFSIIENK